MNLNPATVLNPVFNALDALIQNYGVYLYLVVVWLSLAVIAWVLSGGLRRKQPQGTSATIIPGIIFTMRPPFNHHRQSSASRLTRRGMMTTKQWTNHDHISFPAIRLCPARSQKRKRRHVQFRLTNCIINLHSHAHEACQNRCNHFQVTVQSHGSVLPLL